jgi:16S rRNA processing protein RimM
MTINTALAGPESVDDAPWPDDAIEVARIVDAFGVKGWLKVLPFAAEPKALLGSRRWFLQPALPRLSGGPQRSKTAASGALALQALPRQLRITQVKAHGDAVVASVREVSDRNGAEALRGARIFVSRSSFPSTVENEYYWIDLIGLQVVNRDGVTLGVVTDLLDTGPHCVLRIRRADAPTSSDSSAPVDVEASERLIPFVAAYVDDVSLAQRRISVDWGLDY